LTKTGEESPLRIPPPSDPRLPMNAQLGPANK
jgi:hypothetical protein